MTFTYKYPMVALTVDVVLFEMGGEAPRVLLIKRGGEPFKGLWALPGGFVNVSDDGDQGEDCETAARRELLEETGIEIKYLRELGVVTTPGRDPRGRVVTLFYMGIVEAGSVQGTDAEPGIFPGVGGAQAKPGSGTQVLKAGEDAAEANWFSIREVSDMELAFDHKALVFRAINSLMALGNDDGQLPTEITEKARAICVLARGK